MWQALSERWGVGGGWGGGLMEEIIASTSVGVTGVAERLFYLEGL